MPGTFATNRAWLGLMVLVLPCLLLSIDQSVLTLAAPAISSDLEPTGPQLLWIVDIHGFLLAGSLIAMGAVGDQLGRRRLLLIGSAAFAALSIAAAFATSAEQLIVVRAGLGVAAATLMPSTVALIRTLFVDRNQRSVAIGIWSASFAVGWAIGPLLGGVLLERFWWGAAFLPAVPIVLLILAFGPKVLPESRCEAPGKIDPPSVVLSLLSVLGVVYGIKSVATESFSPVTTAAFVVGIVSGTAFVLRQTRVRDPLVDLALLRNRHVSTALTLSFIASATSVATLFFVAQYFQLVLGRSALEAAFLSLPIAAANFISCSASPFLARRISARVIYIAGLSLAGCSLAWIALIPESSAAQWLCAVMLLTIGLGPVVTLATDQVVSSASSATSARATACSETSIEFGGAIGIALFGSIALAVYRREITVSLDESMLGTVSSKSLETLGAALELGLGQSASEGAMLIGAARMAFVNGVQVASMVALVILIVSAIAAMLIALPQIAGSGDEPVVATLTMDACTPVELLPAVDNIASMSAS